MPTQLPPPTVETLSVQIKGAVAQAAETHTTTVTLLVRGEQTEIQGKAADSAAQKGRLSDPKVDKLVRLLEARSRTSVTVPSLQYKEDPRASVYAAAAARNHLIFGRRGVGKTALLLEVRQAVVDRGECQHWINAQVYRDLTPDEAYVGIMAEVLGALMQRLAEGSGLALNIRAVRDRLMEAPDAGKLIPAVNSALRNVLVPDVLAFYLFIDRFLPVPIRGPSGALG